MFILGWIIPLTSDGWTSITQDHYVTVTVHYVKEDQLKPKVLTTQAVYESQSGPVVAKQIEVIQEFGLREKAIAVTVDNAANMEVAVRQLQIRKLGCFAHTLNLAAQKVYNIPAISKWSARMRDAIVWIKRSPIVKNIFEEKQRLLGKKEINCFSYIHPLVTINAWMHWHLLMHINNYSFKFILIGYYVSRPAGIPCSSWLKDLLNNTLPYKLPSWMHERNGSWRETGKSMSWISHKH